jgi:hypothetical protein
VRTSCSTLLLVLPASTGLDVACAVSCDECAVTCDQNCDVPRDGSRRVTVSENSIEDVSDSRRLPPVLLTRSARSDLRRAASALDGAAQA